MVQQIKIEPSDFAKVASYASWTLMKYVRNEQLTAEDDGKIVLGIQLLQHFENAMKACLKGDLDNPDYLLVRRVFYVQRVEPGQPGWVEWNAAIDRALEERLFKSTPFFSKDGVIATKERLETLRDQGSVVPTAIANQDREFLALLSTWITGYYPR